MSVDISKLDSDQPSDVLKVFTHFFYEALPPRLRANFLTLQTVTNATTLKPLALQHDLDKVITDMVAGQHNNDMPGLWQKYTALTEMAHERAQQNALQRREEDGDFHAYTLPGAMGRIFSNGYKKNVLTRAKVTITTTAHPTTVDAEDYLKTKSEVRQAGPQNLPYAMANFVSAEARREKRKSVLEEIREAKPFFRSIFHAIPALNRDIVGEIVADNLKGKEKNSADIPSKFVKIASWEGADADGNSNITADMLQVSIDEARNWALQFYEESIQSLITLGLQEKHANQLREFLATVPAEPQDNDIVNLEKFRDLLTHCRRQYAGINSQLPQAINNVMEQTHTFGFHLVKKDMRQSTDVHSALIAMIWAERNNLTFDLSNGYTILSEQDKRNFVQNLLKNPENAQNSLNKIYDDLSAFVEKNPELITHSVLLETLKKLRMVKDNPSMMDQYTISNCGDGLGKGIDQSRHALEILALLNTSHAKNLRVVPLLESRPALQSAGEHIATLLRDPLFRENILSNGKILRVMIALSDTSRQHGPGIKYYQEKAATDMALAVLEYNRTAPPEERIQFSPYWGGSLDMTRGGGFQPTYMYHFSRRLTALARKKGYTQEEIEAGISAEIQQTRQGRDRNRLFSYVKSAHEHLSQMIAGVFHMSHFLSVGATPAELEKIIVQTEADEKFGPVCDRAIQRYESFYHKSLKILCLDLVPWMPVSSINQSSRSNARKSDTVQDITDIRAITAQIAYQMTGTHLNAWFGLSVLKDIPLAERKDLMKHSFQMRELVFRGLLNLARTDFDAGWIMLGQEKPDPETCERYRSAMEKIVRNPGLDLADILPNEELTKEKVQVIAMVWLEQEASQTIATLNETLYANPEARKLTAMDALWPFGRLAAETEEMERSTHTSRLWLAKLIDARRNHRLDHVNKQDVDLTMIDLARVVFEGCKTQSTVTNRAVGINEKMITDIINDMQDGKIAPLHRLIRPQFGEKLEKVPYLLAA